MEFKFKIGDKVKVISLRTSHEDYDFPLDVGCVGVISGRLGYSTNIYDVKFDQPILDIPNSTPDGDYTLYESQLELVIEPTNKTKTVKEMFEGMNVSCNFYVRTKVNMFGEEHYISSSLDYNELLEKVGDYLILEVDVQLDEYDYHSIYLLLEPKSI